MKFGSKGVAFGLVPKPHRSLHFLSISIARVERIANRGMREAGVCGHWPRRPGSPCFFNNRPKHLFRLAGHKKSTIGGTLPEIGADAMHNGFSQGPLMAGVDKFVFFTGIGDIGSFHQYGGYIRRL